MQNVFYSWQSDLPSTTNKNAIREALRNARQSSELSWNVDEATRDMSGSGNIPAKILEKIRAADVFVADITPINKDESGRATPNPNVVFELGYAVAHLGWDRIILLSNDAFGELADAPFDFDRHRISTYCLAGHDNAKEDKSSLSRLIKLAVETIIRSNPLRPNDFSRFHAERDRDGKMLLSFMELVHWPTTQQIWEAGPHRRDYVGIEQFDRIWGLYSSPVFYIYDGQLRELIEGFVNAYSAALSHDECYHQAASPLVNIFTNPLDLPLTAEREDKWQTISDGCTKLAKYQNELLEYVRDNYAEIDITVTSAQAWRSIQETIREFASQYED